MAARGVELSGGRCDHTDQTEAFASAAPSRPNAASKTAERRRTRSFADPRLPKGGRASLHSPGRVDLEPRCHIIRNTLNTTCSRGSFHSRHLTTAASYPPAPPPTAAAPRSVRARAFILNGVLIIISGGPW